MEALRLRGRMPVPRFDPRTRAEMAKVLGCAALHRPAPPPEEVKLRGRFHSTARDQAAVSHHYDVSNDFYELLLGETMLYSCALWSDPHGGLDKAQTAKIDLVCRKLDIQPGMRVLDAGCGWGSRSIYAAREYGAVMTAVTLSEEQAAYARKRVAEAGLEHQVEIRVQDYRKHHRRALRSRRGGGDPRARRQRPAELPGDDAPPAQARRTVLPPCDQPVPFRRERFPKPTFINSYVFPDADLHEIGDIVSTFQEASFEVRHVETLRDHYVLTLREWASRLDQCWDDTLRLIGPGRARVWKLYINAAILGFEENRLQIHHILSVKLDRGRSGMSLVPGDWSHHS